MRRSTDIHRWRKVWNHYLSYGMRDFERNRRLRIGISLGILKYATYSIEAMNFKRKSHLYPVIFETLKSLRIP